LLNQPVLTADVHGGAATLTVGLRRDADGGKTPTKAVLKKRDDGRARRDGAQDAYEGSVAVMNQTERRVQTEVEDVLAWLERIEGARLEVRASDLHE
jgi:hypothetical protein